MKRMYTAQVKAGDSAMVLGWVSKIRDMGNIKFFLLRDREGFLQVTAKKGTVAPTLLETIVSLGREDVVLVKGKAIESKQSPGGREMVPDEITILTKADPVLPIDISEKIETNLDKRLDWRPLDLRNPRNTAIFKVQAGLVQGMTSFLQKEGFLQVFTPCLMGAPSESGSEVFPVFYFNREVYLRQDPQLHRELTIAGGLDRIFDLGPSWRAEASHTTRHLCEHRGLAPEWVLQGDESEVIAMEKDVVIAGLAYVATQCKAELELLGVKLTVPETFPELRFPMIYDILKGLGKNLPEGEDLDRESEKLLGEYVKKKYHTDGFFVNRFPFKIKPFYVMKAEEGAARSVDFVYNGTELSSGGQREHRYPELMKQVKEKGMDGSKLQWFTDHFKYGAPPMGGFCIGLERFTMKVLGLENVQEATLFPRTPDRALP